MMRYVSAFILMALLAPLLTLWAHDPILINAEVSTSGAQADVRIDIKQSSLLAGLGDRRSLFDDRADLARLEPRIASMLISGTHLTADGIALPLIYTGLSAEPTPGQELPERLSFHLTGRSSTPFTPATQLTIALTLLQELGGMASIIDELHVTGGPSAAVKPGEELAWSPAQATPPTAPSLFAFVRLGFLHIVPEGLDHILFVVGLFLLSPKLKPLLTQVTAFTVAHSLTLGLSMAGVFTLTPRIVEPLIAVSIAVIALENIWSREVKPWRWLIVFGFGLLHGLGFAGALKDMQLQPGGILAPLIGFNLGVELGQLSVIAGAAALTCWCWQKTWYRTRVVIPASALIAAFGMFWAVQRGLGFGIET